MTWADELFERLIEEGAVTYDDNGRESDYAHKGDCVLIDDLVLAVLEKNKEVNMMYGHNLIERYQARAFRELVETTKRVRK